MVRADIDYDVYTNEELLEMRQSEAVEGLNEAQQRFCECYVQCYNIKTSIVKAGYSANNTVLGYKLRKNRKCQRYIQWLKARILRRTMVTGTDIIEQWVKIAFADMSDFVDIFPNYIKLKPNDQIDGQLIKSIKSGRDGVSIELHDKLKALDNLAKYTADMPKDYKQILEERKVELLEQEFELKKRLCDDESNEQEDDGFIEALKKSAESVWETTEE